VELTGIREVLNFVCPSQADAPSIMKRSPTLWFALLAMCSAHAQSLSPQVVSGSGGGSDTGPVHLSWTLGEPCVSTLSAPGLSVTQGFHQADPVLLRLNARAFLEGAYDSGTGLMRDDLRSGSLPVIYPLIPATQPYGGMPWNHAGTETLAPWVLTVSGSGAIVDWVLVELRDPTTPAIIVAGRAALIQRDGDVVDVDGVSPVGFPGLPSGNYHVSLRHRNHLGVMSATPLSLTSDPAPFDLVATGTPTFGTDARKLFGSVATLWMGNARADDRLKYTGPSNDRDPILLAIGGSTPTATLNGYYAQDHTMNGQVRYTGGTNDRDPILVNILPGPVTGVRLEQLP
jgi:hypothetical protein